MTLACGPVSGGLYVDSPPYRRGQPHAVSSTYVELVAGLGVDHVCVMVDGQGDELDDIRWTEADLRRFASACDAVELTRRILTLWPEPTHDYVEDLEASLGDLVQALGAEAVEFDCERQWATQRLRGYVTRSDAGQAVRDVVERHGVPYEVVTFRGRLPETQSLLVGARRVTMMIYPRRRRHGVDDDPATIADERLVDYDGPLGPGRMVPREVRLARGLLPPRLHDSMGVALAAWSQRWPGVEPYEAMRTAMAGAVDAGARTVRWWSSKHVVGHLSANAPYAAPAIRRLLGGEP